MWDFRVYGLGFIVFFFILGFRALGCGVVGFQFG